MGCGRFVAYPPGREAHCGQKPKSLIVAGFWAPGASWVGISVPGASTVLSWGVCWPSSAPWSAFRALMLVVVSPWSALAVVGPWSAFVAIMFVPSVVGPWSAPWSVRGALSLVPSVVGPWQCSAPSRPRGRHSRRLVSYRPWSAPGWPLAVAQGSTLGVPLGGSGGSCRERTLKFCRRVQG